MNYDEKAGAAAGQRPPLDKQLRRYARSYRRRLRKMAKSSPRMADLLYSYPAAAFVIGSHQGNPIALGEAVQLVKGGAGLGQITSCLGLPIWARRLPPETFTGGFGPLPNSQRFNRQIVNLIPRDPEHCAMWFKWVTKASALCHEDFAIWIARLQIWGLVCNEPDILLPLAAFVWFGDTPGTRARGLIEKAWTPKIGLDKAVAGASTWFTRLLMEDCQDTGGQIGRWFVAQRASAFRIVPLRSQRDLENEGRRMDNCVADYGTAVAAGECLIYGVRRGNKHVATLEVKPSHAMDGTAEVAQLLGPYNDEACEAVHRAVATWLNRQGRYPFIASGNFVLAGFDTHRWNELWAPYLEDRGISKAFGGQAIEHQPILMHRALEALSNYA